LLLGLRGGALRTVVRTPTLFANRRQRPRFLVTPQPQISRRSRNPELPAQPRQSFPLALRADHKLNALLPHACRPPWHGRPSRPATLTPSVKDLLATGVKDVMAPHSTAAPHLGNNRADWRSVSLHQSSQVHRSTSTQYACP